MRPAVFRAYSAWVVHAVVGKLAEADAMLREYRAAIHEGAAAMRDRSPPVPERLYRGVLLQPAACAGGCVAPIPHVQSLSFSRSRDVAAWFADPHSVISGQVLEDRPDSAGYLIEHQPEPASILWHHAWRHAVWTDTGHRSLRSIDSVGYVLLDHLYEQFRHNLHTQEEVIIVPPTDPLPLTPIADVHGLPTTWDLDRRYTPPGVKLVTRSGKVVRP